MRNIRFFVLLLSLAIFCGACQSALRLYKKGNKRFEKGEYQLAIEQYEKAKAKNFSPALTNIALAESYRLSDRLQKSAEYYQQAIEAGTQSDSVHYHYAFALKAQGRYPEATGQFEQFLKSNPSKQVYVARAKKEIENLKKVQEITGNKTYYEIQNLSALNTQASEFAPVFQNDELIFTSSRKQLTYKANGQGFLGLYAYKLGNPADTAGAPRLFSDKINAENQNEGSPTFSRDGKIMIFARGNTGKRKGTQDVDLYISKIKDGQWSDPRMIPVSDSTAWDACPAISADGKTLYFASNREGGLGGIDLYRASLDASGRVGRAVNMGKDINTAGDDMFPYVSQDGRLYFSSDGHPGLGGLDLFVATRVGGKVTIRNLGVPMNSSADDFALVFRNATNGFFSSNREGGKGDDDIYSFEDKTPDIKLVRYRLAGTTVTDDDKNPAAEIPLDNVKVKFLDENGKEINQSVTQGDGRFGTYTLEEGKSYTITTEKPDYFTKRETFSMAGRAIPQELLTKAETDTTFEIKIRMDKIVLEKAIVLENIYYDFDKDNIREDAAEELDKFVQVLNDNPEIKVELSSHTDSKGKDTYNEDLSQRRAESAVKYLISKGINPARITAKGYGESRPIADNENPDGTDNPEGRQLNRRTEFKVLEYKKK